MLIAEFRLVVGQCSCHQLNLNCSGELPRQGLQKGVEAETSA